jgi:hypothetical protein
MESRVLFENACNEIAKAFIEDGFKLNEDGQELKKITNDKDMKYKIHFIWGKDVEYVTIIPQLNISSKELKKWKFVQTLNKHCRGWIYSGRINTPENSSKVWDLVGPGFDEKIKEIISDIKSYFIPIIEIYKDKITAIEYLKNNGTKYFPWMEKTLEPMAFMICFGGKEVAELFLKNWMQKRSYGTISKKLYNEFSKMEKSEIIKLNN